LTNGGSVAQMDRSRTSMINMVMSRVKAGFLYPWRHLGLVESLGWEESLIMVEVSHKCNDVVVGIKPLSGKNLFLTVVVADIFLQDSILDFPTRIKVTWTKIPM